MGITNPGSFTDILRIHNETLDAAGQFDVSGIRQDYSRMEIIAKLRSDEAVVGTGVNIFLNDDTTAANYRRAFHVAGSAHSFGMSDLATVHSCTGDSSPANYFSLWKVLIFKYADTDFKMIQAQSSSRQDATTTYENAYYSLHWENAAAITQVTLQPVGYDGVKFVADSQAQIWLYL